MKPAESSGSSAARCLIPFMMLSYLTKVAKEACRQPDPRSGLILSGSAPAEALTVCLQTSARRPTNGYSRLAGCFAGSIRAMSRGAKAKMPVMSRAPAATYTIAAEEMARPRLLCWAM
jgi:hypothetical protein